MRTVILALLFLGAFLAASLVHRAGILCPGSAAPPALMAESAPAALPAASPAPSAAPAFR